ncbi:hypothetical protein [Pseudobythopirellula maris]|nr:hypothetical protein [Pseudobythopirellula maris]
MATALVFSMAALFACVTERAQAQAFRYSPGPGVSVTWGAGSPYYGRGNYLGRGGYRDYSPYRYRGVRPYRRGILRDNYRTPIFGQRYRYRNWR